MATEGLKPTAATATFHADFILLEVLVALGSVHEKVPARMGDAELPVRTALEIVLKAHRRGGCTPGQIKELELIREKIAELAG